MGSEWILSDEAQRENFKRDWEMGMPLKEMAALHGYRNINSVSRAAHRMGLPKRSGGRRPDREYDLGPGRWVPRRGDGVLEWVPA